jgi:multidrug efflux pump subunit AcrB
MSSFAIKYPFFIIVACLIVAIVGTVALVRMPVDLFPPINIPVVVVATFYSGMPPQEIETNITNPFLGLGSIVELSQAQLQQTQATISNAQAGYDYRLALSVLRYQTIGL